MPNTHRIGNRYVLAHEVIHLVHDDHGHEFWRLLDEHGPVSAIRFRGDS